MRSEVEVRIESDLGLNLSVGVSAQNGGLVCTCVVPVKYQVCT